MRGFAKAFLKGAFALYLFGCPWFLLISLINLVAQEQMPAWLNAIAGAGIVLSAVIVIVFTTLLGALLDEGMEAASDTTP